MTTETPFTVADLRRWATSLRAEADRTAALKYPTPYGLSIIPVYRAQAAAFDALADGIEAGRILLGEKP